MSTAVSEEPLGDTNNNTILDVDEIYAWIDTIPLSRPKRNIARDFADGVLVAEVVAHFFPKLCDLHNYPATSSIAQRKVNWQTLNRRVFSKMVMKVADDTIAQLVDSKPGVIEQVLYEIHAKIDLLRTLPEWKGAATGVRRSKSVGQPRSGFGSGTSTPRSDPHQQQQQKQGLVSSSITTGRAVTAGGPAAKNSRSISRNNFPKKRQTASPPPLTSTSISADPFAGFWSVAGGAEQVVVRNDVPTTTTTSVKGQALQQQGHVASPHSSPVNTDLVQISSLLGGRLSGPSVISPSTKLDEPPSQIMYRGHKMIPLQFLDEKDKEFKALENVNRSLTVKIFRLETLLNIKDQRIEDLTQQLQNFRAMYERLTGSTFSALT